MVDDRRDSLNASDTSASALSDSDLASCVVADPPLATEVESALSADAHEASSTCDAGRAPASAWDAAEVGSSTDDCVATADEVELVNCAEALAVSRAPECDPAPIDADSAQPSRTPDVDDVAIRTDCDSSPVSGSDVPMSYVVGEDSDEVCAAGDAEPQRGSSEPASLAACVETASCEVECVGASPDESSAADPLIHVECVAASSEAESASSADAECQESCSGACAGGGICDRAEQGSALEPPASGFTACDDARSQAVAKQPESPANASCAPGLVRLTASRNRCEVDESNFVMDEPRRKQEPSAGSSSRPVGDGSSSPGLKRFFPAKPSSAPGQRQDAPARAPGSKPQAARSDSRRPDTDDAALDLGLGLSAPPPREPASRDACAPTSAEPKKPNKLIDGIFGVLRKGKKK